MSLLGIDRIAGKPLRWSAQSPACGEKELRDLARRISELPSRPSAMTIFPSQVRLFEKYYESLGHRSPMPWRQSVEARVRLRRSLSRLLSVEKP